MRHLLRHLHLKLWLRLLWRHGLRYLLYVSAVAALVFSIALFVVYLWLPDLPLRKADVERRLTTALAHPVTIGKISPRWRGWYPGMVAHEVRIAPTAGAEPALVLPEVRASIAWLPLVWGQVQLHDLILVHPQLTVERIADGRLQIPGFQPFAPQLKPQTGTSGTPWLFAQRKIRIEDGTIVWRDALSQEPPLTVNRLQLILSNAGQRHHLDVGAAWPAALCAECSLSLDIIFNRRDDWGGQAYLRARQLTLEQLPLIVRERLPGIAGTIDARLNSQWDAAAPFAVNGRIAIGNLRIPENLWTKPITLAQAHADIDWRRGADYWNVQLSDVFIGGATRPWVRGALRFTREPSFTALEADYINVAALMPVLAKLENKPRLLEIVRALEPKGELTQFHARVDGWPEIENFSIDSRVDEGALAAYQSFPGFRGISGRVRVTRDGGKFNVERYAGDLQFPRVFIAPLPISAGKGEIVWRRTDTQWEIGGNHLSLRNRDGELGGEFALQLPLDKSQSPHLHVRAHAPEANVADTALYLPTNVLKEPVRDWLKRFIVGGKIKDARVVVDGPVRQFPFDQGGGEFKVSATVNDGVFNYLPGWPAIDHATAAVLFSGSEVLVNGRGNVRGLELTDLAVRIPDLRASGGAEVLLGGRLGGSVDNALQVLRSVQGTPGGYVPKDLHGGGFGVADLRLIVPLRDAKAFRLAVDYQFLNGILDWPSAKMHADTLNGTLNFSELGLLGGAVQGKLLGGDAKVDIRTLSVNPLRVRAEAQGKITRAGLEHALGDPWATLVSGNSDWRAIAEVVNGALQVQADADLQAISVNLPAPMNKPVGVPARLSVRSENSTRDLQLIDVRVGDLASAKLGFARDDKGWQLARGRIHLGEGRAAWPTVPGVHLSVLWPYTDGDRWSAVLRKLGDNVPAAPASYNDLLPAMFTRASVDIAALELFYRPWGRVAFDIKRDSNAWSGNVRGNNVVGAVNVSGYAYNRTWQLNLDQLTIPARREVQEVPEPERPTKDLPTVYINAKSFQWGKAALGRLAFWALPFENGWRIQHLVLSRPEMNLFVKGDWTVGGQLPQHTALEVEFNSDDFGATLAALNIPDQVRGGKVNVTGKAAWDGAPSAFSIGKVQSNLVVNGERGQFLKLKQGAGKLLGLFDINSLGRYLSLDFSSIFERGYAFDRLSTNVTLDRGNALTRDFNMRGPSADVGITGRVGIVGEDFDLEVTVEPHLRSSIALVGGLTGGPVGFGAALLLERILKKPIAAGTRLLYTVQGDWANPVVRRVVKEAPAEPQTQPISP